MSNPFDLNDNEAYRRWRERKLEDYPTSLEQLVVEIDDPRQLTPAEYEALAPSRTGEDPDKEIVRQLGLQFGLERLDHNMCADDDAISSLEHADTEPRTGYIPYTNRPIAWHTDGLANRVHKRNVLPEMQGVVDSLSISMNPADPGPDPALRAPGA